jgi:antitoxin ParD1/3/4
MSDIEKLSVALEADMIAEVRAAVADGDYASVNEAVSDALRDWSIRRRVEKLETRELKRLVLEGIESGPGLDADDVFAELRARFAKPAG